MKALVMIILAGILFISGCSDRIALCYYIQLDNGEVSKKECRLEDVNQEKLQEMVPINNPDLERYIDAGFYRRRAFVFVWKDENNIEHCNCTDSEATEGPEEYIERGCTFIKEYLPNESSFQSCFK